MAADARNNSADRIAYLSHDAEDAIRAGVLRVEDFPADAIAAFGAPGRQWIDSMVRSVIDHSLASGEIAMEPTQLAVMHELRSFMFERVYLHPEMEPHRHRAKRIVRDLVGHFHLRPSEIPATYRHDDADITTQVIDYVAGMTDRYAIATHDKLFRDPREVMTVGWRRQLPGMSVEVLDQMPDARPRTARFCFDRALEDASRRWIAFDGARPRIFDPPAIGESVTFDP